MDDIWIDIPDHKLVRRYGQMPWVRTEDRIIPVVRRLDAQGRADIRLHAFRNLRKAGLHFPFRRQFETRLIEQMSCFYTGVRLHLTATALLYGNNFNILPWTATREHVAARRGNDLSKVNTLGNLVPCAYLLNRMVAHMPLAVKLYERDCLARIAYDRTAMTLDLAQFIRRTIIDQIEQPFWFEGNYPWFAHVYVGSKARPEITEFARLLRAHEDEFLALDWQRQRSYLRQPLDIDLPAIARRILGVGPAAAD